MDFDFCHVIANKNNLYFSNYYVLHISNSCDIITTNGKLLIVTRLDGLYVTAHVNISESTALALLLVGTLHSAWCAA